MNLPQKITGPRGQFFILSQSSLKFLLFILLKAYKKFFIKALVLIWNVRIMKQNLEQV